MQNPFQKLRDAAIVASDFDKFIKQVANTISIKKKLAGIATLVGVIFGFVTFFGGGLQAPLLVAYSTSITVLLIFAAYYYYVAVFQIRRYSILDPNIVFTERQVTFVVLGGGNYRMEVKYSGYPKMDRYKSHTQRFLWTGDRSKTRLVEGSVSGEVSINLDDSDSRYTHVHFHFEKERARGENFSFSYAIELADAPGSKSLQHFSQRSDRYLINKSKFRIMFPSFCKGEKVIYNKHVGTKFGMAVSSEPLSLVEISDGGDYVYVDIEYSDKKYIHLIDYKNLKIE